MVGNLFASFAGNQATANAQRTGDYGAFNPNRVYAGGGAVSGPGTSTSDSISARLSDGEFVINADAVKKYGQGLFESLNAKKFAMGGPVSRFANGGSVRGYASGGAVTSAQAVPNVEINVNNQTGTNTTAELTDMKFDGEKYIATIALKAMTGQDGRKAMRNTYGMSAKGYKGG